MILVSKNNDVIFFIQLFCGLAVRFSFHTGIIFFPHRYYFLSTMILFSLYISKKELTAIINYMELDEESLETTRIYSDCFVSHQ